jgi:hypothetical protein
MFETVMMLQAERGASRRRELAADSLLARAARLVRRCACHDEAQADSYARPARAAPHTQPGRGSYAQAA